MDLEQLQKYLEKIDFNQLRKNNIKLSEDDTYIGELYNSAIDNIKQDNLDVAAIKLNRVIKLDPTFEKAKTLLEQINLLNEDKSLGQKMEEAFSSREERARMIEKSAVDQQRAQKKGTRQKYVKDDSGLSKRDIFTPHAKRRKISPFGFMKFQLVAIVVLLVIIAALSVIIVYQKSKHDKYVDSQPDLLKTIESLEKEISTKSEDYEKSLAQYKKRIAELEDGFLEKIEENRKTDSEIYSLQQVNNLYYAIYLFNSEKYNQAYTLLDSTDTINSNFDSEQIALHNEYLENSKKNIAIALYQSGNKLYQDLKYKDAYENFIQVWNYYKDHESAKKWQSDTLYSNIIYDSVYKMAKCAYEIKEYEISIEGYSFLESEKSEFADMNKEGIIYHSAKAYAAIGDLEKAEQLFLTVINEYPESELVPHAKGRLATVQKDLNR